MASLVLFVRSVFAGANVAQGISIMSNLPGWLRSFIMLAVLGLVVTFGFNVVGRLF